METSSSLLRPGAADGLGKKARYITSVPFRAEQIEIRIALAAECQLRREVIGADRPAERRLVPYGDFCASAIMSTNSDASLSANSSRSTSALHSSLRAISFAFSLVLLN
jgi:hypothetical protein